MRLIDADALLDTLRKSHKAHANNSREFSLLERDLRLVNDAPTIDAVPVVRCGECKNNQLLTVDYEITGGFSGCCDITGCLTRQHEFCSDGERREVDGDG